MKKPYINARLLRLLGWTQADVMALYNVKTTALEAASYAVWNPPSVVWNANASGTFPAGNPSSSATVTFYDKDDNVIATRTVTGTLTSSSGLVNVVSGSSTGYTTSVNFTNNNSKSVRADVTIAFPSGSSLTTSAGFSSIDPSTAATTPATGGGK